VVPPAALPAATAAATDLAYLRASAALRQACGGQGEEALRLAMAAAAEADVDAPPSNTEDVLQAYDGSDDVPSQGELNIPELQRQSMLLNAAMALIRLGGYRAVMVRRPQLPE
jgi:hypothetical protein